MTTVNTMYNIRGMVPGFLERTGNLPIQVYKEVDEVIFRVASQTVAYHAPGLAMQYLREDLLALVENGRFGETPDLEYFPELTREDILACLENCKAHMDFATQQA